jgi:single-strand DNA-binding protein
MNKVILIGRLTKDPDLRTISSGISVCRFTLAVDRPYKSANSDSPTADFFNIVTWRNLADNCGKYLSKGRPCAVSGTIQNRSYEKDGEKRYITEIIADSVEFLGGGGNSSNNTDNETDEFGKKQSINDLPSVDDDDQLPF